MGYPCAIFGPALPIGERSGTAVALCTRSSENGASLIPRVDTAVPVHVTGGESSRASLKTSRTKDRAREIRRNHTLQIQRENQTQQIQGENQIQQIQRENQIQQIQMGKPDPADPDGKTRSPVHVGNHRTELLVCALLKKLLLSSNAGGANIHMQRSRVV
nr:hypothetical protein BaRGS_030653 [Batillaria attramentaria]